MTRLHGASCPSGGGHDGLAGSPAYLVAGRERSVQCRLDLLEEEPDDRTAIDPGEAGRACPSD